MKSGFFRIIVPFAVICAVIPSGWTQDTAPEETPPAGTETAPLLEKGVGAPPVENFAPSEEGRVTNSDAAPNTIFDDKMLLAGYAQKYASEPKEILIEMVKDDALTSYKMAAAVRVFKEKYSHEVVSREKKIVERLLLRRLNRDDSPFVQVEIMHTLCRLDRYHYFASMVPALIQKMDHYNSTVNDLAFESLNDIVQSGGHRTREARIVFNTLRKILFLSRKRLANIKEPGPKLTQKLKLLRWSIKVLGTEELKRLPSEVKNLL